MEIMGILEIKPGEGSVVSDFNVKPFLSMVWPAILADKNTEKDLLEFRKILEEGSIRHLALRGESEEFFKSLKDIVDNMEEVIDDAEKSVKLDIQFHRCLFELTGNNVLMQVQNFVEYILERTVSHNRTAALEKKDSGEAIFKQHKDIYEALVVGDSLLAVKRMSYHLDYVQSIS
ncbi:HTH-type transcriptional regulator LutR [bioreactor metagenome]|uniref:HTH-type transcriptional regulator LutR n=1 Tax=bioreactor metagenome TaxID=1076179 RepID=A0A645APK3_9ZZZZ